MNPIDSAGLAGVALATGPAIHAGPSEPALHDMTLGDLLAWAAMTAPDRAALVAGSQDANQRREWTYAELYSQSLRVARALHARFKPGERVAVWSPNHPEWVMLEFGAAMAGVVLVSVNPACDASELEHVLKQSGAAGIVLSTSYGGQAMLPTVQALAARCRGLREVVRLDRWNAFIASADDAQAMLPATRSDDVVTIQYTAGTTDLAKGARLRHVGLVNNAVHTAERLGVQDGDVWIGAVPLHQAAGCGLMLLGSVAKRATLVLAEELPSAPMAELVVELLDSYRGNVLLATPALLEAVLEHGHVNTAELSSLRVLGSVGGAVSALLVKACGAQFGVPLVTVYGLTEASPACMVTSPGDTLAVRSETLGAPLPGVEVRITQPGKTQTLAIGEVGEICTRGYHVMPGYHEQDEATARAIDSEGWLHSGDLGRMDARGYIAFAGRMKDVIQRGAESVHALELEEVLRRHPKVSEAAVLGLPDAAGGETVAAFIRPHGDELLSKDELYSHVRRHLAVHKTPRHWFLVNHFPTSGAGRIQKFKLREHFTQGMLVAM